MSSRYISNKYGKTLAQMFKDELISNLSEKEIKEIIKNAKSKYKSLEEAYNIGEINYSEFYQKYYGLINENFAILDSIKSVYTRKFQIPKVYAVHDAAYFEGYYADEYRGAEVFAEITGSIMSQKDSNYINFIKKYAPNTLDIYYEILGEIK